jgi:hypothetical protein
VSQYADTQGVWEWREAPVDEFKADICPPIGTELLEQPLIASDEDYVFRVPRPLVISGSVVDAVTRQPVKDFLMVPGLRWDVTHMNWARGEGFTATDGYFEYRPRRGSWRILSASRPTVTRWRSHARSRAPRAMSRSISS